jgi:hypothetical protein
MKWILVALILLCPSLALAEPGCGCGQPAQRYNIQVAPGKVEVRLGFSPVRRLFGGGNVLVVKQGRPQVRIVPAK